VKFGVVFYWNDSRVAGADSPLLPKNLWGPEISIISAMGKIDCEYEQFAFLDRKAGRLKRIINYGVSVPFSMNLRDFPFDIQTLTVDIATISHWSLRDRSDHGSLPKGQSYSLTPVTAPGEGDFMVILWDGSVPEWKLHGHSVSVKAVVNEAAGFTATKIALSFHASRKALPYVTSIMGPLFMLALTSFALQFVPVETSESLAGRISASFTMFLAAFALIYVCANDTPKISFVSHINMSIILVLITLLWLVIESYIVFRLMERNGGTHGGLWDGGSQAWDDLFLIIGPIFYVFWNVIFFFGPALRQRKHVAEKLKELELHGVKHTSNTDFDLRGSMTSGSTGSIKLRELATKFSTPQVMARSSAIFVTPPIDGQDGSDQEVFEPPSPLSLDTVGSKPIKHKDGKSPSGTSSELPDGLTDRSWNEGSLGSSLLSGAQQEATGPGVELSLGRRI
jgi:uncharacterized Tic20 family protein